MCWKINGMGCYDSAWTVHKRVLSRREGSAKEKVGDFWGEPKLRPAGGGGWSLGLLGEYALFHPLSTIYHLQSPWRTWRLGGEFSGWGEVGMPARDAPATDWRETRQPLGNHALTSAATGSASSSAIHHLQPSIDNRQCMAGACFTAGWSMWDCGIGSLPSGRGFRRAVGNRLAPK